MMRLKRSAAHGRISPVFLSRLTVLTASAVPAQLTRMRSCPMAARALARGGVHLLLGHHVHIAVNAAEFASQRLADGFVHVEDGDFDAMAGQTPGRGGSQAGSAPVMTAEMSEFSCMVFPRWVRNRRYWPVKLGVRLPRNAACPSRLSAERKATRKLRFSCSRPCASGVSKLASAASFASATASGRWLQSGWPSPTPSAGPGHQPSLRRPCLHRKPCGRR